MLFLLLACQAEHDTSFNVVSRPTTEFSAPANQNNQAEEPEFEDSTEVIDDDCFQDMSVHTILPEMGSRAPLNTKPIVMSIGDGNLDNITIELLDEDAQVIQTREEVDCYIHESYSEQVCTHFLNPVNPLEPNTKYTVRSTQGDDVLTHWFTTSNENLESFDNSLELEAIGYAEREEITVDYCDWDSAFQYDFEINLEAALEYPSIVEVFEVPDSDTAKEQLVHTLVMPVGSNFMEFHQVIEPNQEGEHCYRIDQRDIAGNYSRYSEIVCEKDDIF